MLINRHDTRLNSLLSFQVYHRAHVLAGRKVFLWCNIFFIEQKQGVSNFQLIHTYFEVALSFSVLHFNINKCFLKKSDTLLYGHAHFNQF